MAIQEIPLRPEQKRLANMLKALGNPIRYQIVEFLAQKKLCITADFGINLVL